MSDDLIKRKDVIAILGVMYERCDTYDITDYRDLMIEAVKALPSADRPQGEWIDYIGYDLGIEGQWLRDDGKTVFVQCDQCDSILVRNLMTHMNYCPNCGARMFAKDINVPNKKGADDE